MFSLFLEFQHFPNRNSFVKVHKHSHNSQWHKFHQENSSAHVLLQDHECKRNENFVLQRIFLRGQFLLGLSMQLCFVKKQQSFPFSFEVNALTSSPNLKNYFGQNLLEFFLLLLLLLRMNLLKLRMYLLKLLKHLVKGN